MKPFYVLVLFLASVHARVAGDLTDTELNTITAGDSNIKIAETLVIKIKENEDLTGDKLVELKLLQESKNTCQDIDNNIVQSENVPCDRTVNVDNGTALILTPLIEQGRIAEARNASRVDHKLFLGIESYSGFLTVNSTYKSHLFFWYFPSFAKPVNETPWIIWLQGGPGASSLTGLFDEIGPFTSDSNGNLRFNPHTWLMNHSLVFIDNPVGTGYSFTEHKDGYAKDMDTYGKHLHTSVKQLVQLFPELRVAPLYVAGESYAGKYVPVLGVQIHRHKQAPGADINLKGLIIGNALVEPAMISQLNRPFYHFGLLEKEQIEIVQPLLDAFQADIAANKSIEAKEKWNRMITVFLILSHQKHAYNFLTDDMAVGRYVTLLNKPEVKRAIHVGDIKFSWVNITVNTELAPDFLSSTKPFFEELLEEYRVLTYCGQLDQMVPCAHSAELYRGWQWKESNQFLASLRLPYIHNRKLAGYYKTGGGLTWVVIRGAGHMVPLDKPQASQGLVTSWTHDRPLVTAQSMHPDFLKEFVRSVSTPNSNATFPTIYL